MDITVLEELRKPNQCSGETKTVSFCSRQSQSSLTNPLYTATRTISSSSRRLVLLEKNASDFGEGQADEKGL